MTDAGVLQRLITVFVCLRVGLTYTLFSALKHVVPVATLVRWAWRPAGPRGRVACNRAIAAVGRIQRRMAGGAPNDCLQSALVRYRELSSAGADPHLVMGFSREGTALIGHAWVEVDGVPVAEAIEDVMRFTRTATFGERGRRLFPGPSAV
jgi:hypothetical protein